ncbi:hypothetical protein [Ruegeria sp.]|uniref:hypothetical protein n=1 Tax=Ruegeria sp. TaxID=1879320 RepID=UPI003B005CE5
MSDDRTDRHDPQTAADASEAGPFEQSREPATRGDVAAATRWLDGRVAGALEQRREQLDRHIGAQRVTNDHLVMIRSETAKLGAEMSKGFDMICDQTQMLQRDIHDRRGRIRWLLAVLLGFVLGLATPLERVWSLIQGTGG